MTLAEQLDALLHHAAVFAVADRAFLRITGSDATRWLNGMVTNNVAALAPGEGNENFLLNAQGRIQAHAMIYRADIGDTASAPEFLLATTAGSIASIQQYLDRFIIMDDVELAPALEESTSLLLLGPEAPVAAAALGLPAIAPSRLARVAASPRPLLLVTAAAERVPCLELGASSEMMVAITRSLSLPSISPEALETLRILEGRPRFGVDIRDRDLPQETGQTQALNFNKGCYLGQEIVERIHSRGQVHRIFSGFRLKGTVPITPAILQAESKPVGELTSVAVVPLGTGTVTLALGYIRREALDRSLTLAYDGGEAVPTVLPFTL